MMNTSLPLLETVLWTEAFLIWVAFFSGVGKFCFLGNIGCW